MPPSSSCSFTSLLDPLVPAVAGSEIHDDPFRPLSKYARDLIADAGGIDLATDAMREGAYDFQLRPLNLSKMLAVIQRAISHQQLVTRVSALAERLDERLRIPTLTGNSRAMQTLTERIAQIAEIARQGDGVAGYIHEGRGMGGNQPFAQLAAEPGSPVLGVDTDEVDVRLTGLRR